MFKARNTIYSVNTMESLKKTTGSTDFENIMLSFSLTKLRIEYERGREAIEAERKKILERLCNKDDDGSPKLTPQGQYTFTSENGLKFQEEIKALYEVTETEINMDKITIDVDDIPIILVKKEDGSYKKTRLLSPDDMYYLMELIEFKEPKPAKNEKIKDIRPKKPR